MPRYDFKALSPRDFEELTRDLLQAEWGIAFEAFKPGRDQGIDLRHRGPGTPQTIVQCKHYAGSTFAKLLSQLRSEELPKVVRLAPCRYVVVTSLALSDTEKDKILEVMRPFLASSTDIFGLDDLNGLLARQEAVERRNFKLWLTSTEVIARILHNAEACQTEFEVERIRNKIPLFVQSSAYAPARQLLDEQGVVILSGVPGVGKTTLAEMLMFAHLDDGYEPVVIQTDVAEGKRLFRASRKQIFYYDDFLGQTFLGDQKSYVGRNHDAALLSFMEMVRGTPNSRFILTTREHILRQAVQASERLQHSVVQTYKCVLELGDYSLGQRARILYNHLYFSKLSRPYREAILQNDFFLEVIQHEHFNPRLIEWLTSLTRLNSPTAEAYRECVSALLKSPEHIWSHAFHAQISDAARDLLLTCYSLGHFNGFDQLEPAFEAIHRGSSERYNRPRQVGDYRAALKELDGGFLSYRGGHASFLNPSIRDFMAGVLRESPRSALNLIVDAVAFRQLVNVLELISEVGGSELRSLMVMNVITLCRHVTRLLTTESVRWESTPNGRQGFHVDTGEEWRLDKIVAWTEAMQITAFVDLARSCADLLLRRWNTQQVDFHATVQALGTMRESAWFMANGGLLIYRTVLNGVLSHVSEAWSNDWISLLRLPEDVERWTDEDDLLLGAGLARYQSIGVRDEQDSCRGASQLTEFMESLASLEKDYGLGFGARIASLEEEIQEHEDHANWNDDEGGGFSGRSGRAAAESMSEDEVRAMFHGLVPRET